MLGGLSQLVRAERLTMYPLFVRLFVPMVRIVGLVFPILALIICFPEESNARKLLPKSRSNLNYSPKVEFKRSEAFFYGEDHQCIYGAILDLNRRFQPIDLLTVTERLKKRNHLKKVGGPF